MAKTLIKFSLFLFLTQMLAGCGPAPEPTVLEEWGLGREESGYVSLNRDDPFGAWLYADGTRKGQDRYYLADEVINGMENVDVYYGSENVEHYLVISARE